MINPSATQCPESFELNLHAKITHAVERLLAQIPCTNGLNVTKLLSFLKYPLLMKEIPELNDNQLLQGISTEVRPPLKDRIRSKYSIHDLHTTLLKYSFPNGIYEEFKRNTVL